MNPLLEGNNDCRIITSVLTEVLGAQFGVTVLPARSAEQLRPVVENVAAEQYRLVIPIGEDAGKTVVAVGSLKAAPGEILEKLLGLAVRHVRQGRTLQEQRLDLEAYAEQVSRDLEELAWLRGLLEHLRDRDETTRPESLAKSILRPLCDLIQAEEIVLVVAGSRDAAPDDTVPPVGEVGPRAGPGEQVLDDQSCCILVDRLREVAQGQSLVQTGMKRRREFSMLPKVDSCIIVPVVRRQSLLGWLLAVNRTPAKPPRQAPPDNAPLRSPDDDFGTFEANLLDFAGVILAAHPCSADLFGQEATARPESPVAS